MSNNAPTNPAPRRSAPPPSDPAPVSAEVALWDGASLSLALRLAGGGSDLDVQWGAK